MVSSFLVINWPTVVAADEDDMTPLGKAKEELTLT